MEKDFRQNSNEQAQSAIEKGNKQAKDFALKIIPSGLWTAATIWGSVALALNTKADPLYVILGVIASAGSFITTFKVYKNYSKEYEK